MKAQRLFKKIQLYLSGWETNRVVPACWQAGFFREYLQWRKRRNVKKYVEKLFTIDNDTCQSRQLNLLHLSPRLIYPNLVSLYTKINEHVTPEIITRAVTRFYLQ